MEGGKSELAQEILRLPQHQGLARAFCINSKGFILVFVKPDDLKSEHGFNGLYGWGVRLFHQLDKLCFYLDGGGEVALLEVDEEAFVLAAPLAHQTALETVETAADDAYALAV